MSDGNKRYLGDVFINAENYERQKQFFKDIIESYQYKYGGSFDAATLQGFQPSDFATKEQGEKADKALLGPIYLGRQRIENISDSQYIYTDAVLVDQESSKLDSIEWFNDLPEGYDVTDALRDIYRNAMLIEENNLDVSVYENFYNNDYTPIKNLIRDSFQKIINSDGEEECVINASLVNGLRFCLITQDAYNNLPASKKNFWRNVFIIKDSSEIPADYHNPLQLDLTDGYEFRVYNGFLQVSNVLSNTWEDICSLSSLLDGANMDDFLSDYLATQGYVINPDSLLVSLAEISDSDVNQNWDDYPFLNKGLRSNFISGITLDGSASNVTTSLNDAGLKVANLKINNHITNKINTTLTPLTNRISIAEQGLSSAQQDIFNLQGNYNMLNDYYSHLDAKIGTENSSGIAYNLKQVSDKLDNAIDCLRNVKDCAQDIRDGLTEWKNATISGIYTSDNISSEISTSYNLYNETLGLAIFSYNFSHYFLKSNWATYSNGGSEQLYEWYEASKKKGSYNNTPWGVRLKAVPEKGQWVGHNVSHPTTLVRLSSDADNDNSEDENEGKIFVCKTEKDNSEWTHFAGTIIYKYAYLREDD